MKKKLLLILCTLWSLCASSQGYNNNYLLDRLACVFRGLHVRNDTLLAHGYVVDTFPPYPPKYVIGEFDLNGNAITHHTEVLDTNSEYFTQSHFLIEQDEKMTFVGVKNVYNGGVLVRLHPSGAIDLHKEFLDTNSAGFGFKQIVQLRDSSYIILAEQYDGAGTMGTAIVQVSYTGDFGWKKMVSFVERSSSLTLLDSVTILVSTTRTVGTGFNQKVNTKFYTLDLDGTITGTWTDTSNKSYGANKYLPLNDGGGIYVSRWLEQIRDLGGSPPSYTGMLKGYIVREDAMHSKLWEIKLGHPSAIPNLFQVKQLLDGNFIAVGGTFDTTYTDGQPYKNTGWIIKFDANGTVLWQRKYFNTSDKPAQTNYLYDFVELSDGGIVAAGERIDYFEDYPQRGWLLRLDGSGCVLSNDCGLVGIEEADEPIGVTVYPNPASDEINIATSDNVKVLSAAIFAIDGSICKTVSFLETNTLTLPVGDLKSGIYFVSLNRDSDYTYITRFVKE